MCFPPFLSLVHILPICFDSAQVLYIYCYTRSRSFNFTFRYTDDVLSLNNSRFGDFVDRIYPIEFEIKDTAEFSHCDLRQVEHIYPWSFVTQIFLNGQSSHGGDRKSFEVMTSA
jgi:hypothetical protein